MLEDIFTILEEALEIIISPIKDAPFGVRFWVFLITSTLLKLALKLLDVPLEPNCPPYFTTTTLPLVVKVAEGIVIVLNVVKTLEVLPLVTLSPLKAISELLETQLLTPAAVDDNM